MRCSSGHRVYRNFDPRANVLRAHAKRVLELCGTKNEPLMDVAQALEAAALGDEFFTTRKLFPNVDFYSGIIYRALGFPVDFFPVLFALPRAAGWLAHWRESLLDRERSIMRPRQIYTGEDCRPYKEVDEREATGAVLESYQSSNATARRQISAGRSDIGSRFSRSKL